MKKELLPKYIVQNSDEVLDKVVAVFASKKAVDIDIDMTK